MQYDALLRFRNQVVTVQLRTGLFMLTASDKGEVVPIADAQGTPLGYSDILPAVRLEMTERGVKLRMKQPNGAVIEIALDPEDIAYVTTVIESPAAPRLIV